MPPPSRQTGEQRPRALVIDHAWRALGPGLESLSGPGGAPLTRAVKLIVLPLIVRPAAHPGLAVDFLGPGQAAQLDSLIEESGTRLMATAQWFTLLKRTRRTLGIVAGNPQDLYFSRCFELATVHGAPSGGSEVTARAVVAELAETAGGRTVEALRTHLSDPVRRLHLDGELATAWKNRSPAPPGRAVAVITQAGEVLEACGSPGRPAVSAGYTSMVDARHGELFGRVLWSHTDAVWGPDGPPAHLGLTARKLPPRPEVGSGASTATLPAPLDRTLFERLFAVVRSSARRDDLPTVPDLIGLEAARSCAPLGLHDETLRVSVVLGGGLASGLDPLGTREAAVGRTAAHRAVNGRWRREASVLRARRMTVSPRPDPDGGVLDALAQDLRTPWVTYMRRLWVRLHGRDVRGAPLGDLASAWEVLDGVARSVMMDHRTRVRSALRALSGVPARTTGQRGA
ncbi:hypothetical protein OG206_02305 [Streptomyces sp. NBC_01341]|uniref:hypothetical protein n=1 Tax=Streptomyces sp. NBC_01341 TaxID=2903831 RepID=UPI002E14212B|nr:hypothetical protein OG206_02305 [Streptomyces sp. NBC_01341]